MKKIINKFVKQVKGSEGIVKETADVATGRKLPDFNKTVEFDKRKECEPDETTKNVAVKKSDSM